MNEHETTIYEETPEQEISPIAVYGEMRITHHVVVREEAADFGSYVTMTFTSGNDVTQQAIPYDSYRKVAYIMVQTGGPVYIGTQAQVQANPSLGSLLNIADQLVPITHKQPVWITNNGSAASVSIIQERWEK